jgi:hypothetical protein
VEEGGVKGRAGRIIHLLLLRFFIKGKVVDGEGEGDGEGD